MNIRNLLLASMIFCISSIACATSSVILTKQDQEKIIGWTQIVKSLPSKVRELVKIIISLHKEITEFQLSTSHINDVCTSESKKNLFEGMNVLLRYVRRDANSNDVMQSRWETKWQKVEDLRAQLNSDERATEEVARFTGELWIPVIIGNHELRSLFSGRVVTEGDMITMEKILALYSFALECL